jgi:hypothetical protein
MSKLIGQSTDKGLSAIRKAKKQLSFDLNDELMAKVKEISIRDGISPNDVVRRAIGLDVNPPKRPRISLSMTMTELEKVSNKMNLNPENATQLKQGIKEAIQIECEKD